MASCGTCCRELPPGPLQACCFCGAALARPQDDRYVGRTIAEKYLVNARLGRGGMGEVYEATHLTLDRPVALKVLHESFLSDASMVQRFHREARAASRLYHPNSICILDFGQTEDGALYIVMEYVAGRSLAKLLAEEFPLGEPRVVRIVAQILDALAAAHAAGIIHRDLKPANVMIERRRDEPDFVKVLDFGIAKLREPNDRVEQHADAGVVLGTTGYMSPEQLRGEDLDPRSDLYAVGVILYELLADRLPFDAEDPNELAARSLSESPRPFGSYGLAAPPVTPALEAVVMRALARDRTERFSSAEEMRQALLACDALAGACADPVSAHRDGLPLPGRGSPRERPSGLALARREWPTGVVAAGPAAATASEAGRDASTPGAPPTAAREVASGHEPGIHAPATRGAKLRRTFARFVDALRPAQEVMLGASAQSAARRGERFPARFVAYPARETRDVEQLLTNLDARAGVHLGVRRCRWKAGTRVRVQLSGPHVHVHPAADEFVWNGACCALDFEVEVDANAPEGSTTLRFGVLVEGVTVASFLLSLEVANDRATRWIVTRRARPAATAFASYASQDRARVLDRISALQTHVGIDVFVDCLSLRSGERWRDRLEAEIRRREVFLLFWSHHARASLEVEHEWRIALEQKGKEGIEPHALDPPSSAPPPAELSDLQFADVYSYLRAADSTRA